MKKTLQVASLLIVISSLLLSGCSSKETTQDSPLIEPNPEKHTAIETGKVAETAPVDFEAAYFEYDQSSLKPQAKKALKKNISFLKANPKVKIQIEGLCDERGSEAYNQALGLKRAQSVKRHLVQNGISGDRIEVVSGGKIPGSSETEMAKNRRAGFVLVYTP